MQAVEQAKQAENIQLLEAALAGQETCELWNDWATLQYGSGNVEEAERGYRRALQIEPAERQPAVNLGLLLFAQGRLQDAMPFLNRHKETLTEEERRAILQMAAQLKGQVAEKNSCSAARGLPEQKSVATETLATPKEKPECRSFDLFDTLIARRCIDPKQIFHIVEDRLQAAGFAQARIEAEAQLQGTVYTLEDIYARLAEIYPVVAEKLVELKEEELAAEKENLFPIQEVIDEVRHGDIVVSDMYLPYGFIRSIMDQYGALRQAPLVLTCHGKATGQVWAGIQEKFRIREHRGDNPHSDVRSAQRAGIAAVHIGTARLTQEEQTLREAGMTGLAGIMREARLSSSSSSRPLRHLQIVQTQANFPLLFIASLILHRTAVARGYQRLLMSSRDCYLWSELHQEMKHRLGGEYEVHYFLTSRIARAFPTREYLDYANGLLSQPSCIVDLCGTGWSLKRLLGKTHAPQTPTMLLYRYQNVEGLRNFYESLGPTDARGDVFHFLTGDPHNATVERANFAAHPMLDTVSQVHGEWCPVYTNPAGIQWNEIPEIATQHDIFLRMCRMTASADLSRDLEATPEVLMRLMEVCYRNLAGCRTLYTFADTFTAQEESCTHQILKSQAQAERATSAGIPESDQNGSSRQSGAARGSATQGLTAVGLPTCV